ncbi:phosphatidylinositol transfer protein 3 [Quercus suber]|uniref:Phosphatidylinositol transfer protein 3 n=1 Tax=Quercus suber TaxID=58331 RepID=A0AAW0JN70_QUESU
MERELREGMEPKQEEEKEERLGNNNVMEMNEKENEIEQSKVGIMRALVEREDPSAKDVDDLMIRRFLRARFVVYSLDKICSRMPRGEEKFLCIGDLEGWGYSNSDIRGYLAALSILQDCFPERLGKLIIVHVPYIFMTAWKMVYPFIDSKTKKKIIFVENKKLKSTLLSDIEESQLPAAYGGQLPLDVDDLMIRRFLRARFVVYSLDKICSRMPRGEEKFLCIGDLEGWGYSNSDIRGYLAALSILQDCFPERLGKLIIVHVPYIFMTAWKMVYPFIDSKTKKKIIFVENKKLKSTLLSDIEESQLPAAYGGQLPLVPIQDT